MASSLLHKSIFLLSLALLQHAQGLVAQDEVKALPGWDAPLPSRHFSGYINFSSSKHMHYYLVEAEAEEPNKLPLILWVSAACVVSMPE